jgi:hypothetical protein
LRLFKILEHKQQHNLFALDMFTIFVSIIIYKNIKSNNNKLLTLKHIRVIIKIWKADPGQIVERQGDACFPCVMGRVECKFQNTVTHMAIDRQRLAKYISGTTLSTLRHPFLGNNKKHAFLIKEDGVFRGVRLEYLQEAIERITETLSTGTQSWNENKNGVSPRRLSKKGAAEDAVIKRDCKKNSVVLSPLANYTDRAIAAGQRS